MERKRPHIIIFNPDEMRWDTMGHMGNPAAITPFMDRMIKEDTVSFRHAYCQNGVCVPSRCSFFTGLYPHVHGHRTMRHLLHPGESNLFSELREAGYYVWMNDRNDLFAAQMEGWQEANADEIFKPERSWGKWGAPAELPERKADVYSHYNGKIEEEQAGKGGDDLAVAAAVEKIKNWDKEQPLCMFLGLLNPHVPYQVEEPYFSAIDRNKLPERIRLEKCRDKSRMLYKIHEYEEMDTYSEEEWDELRAVYLGMCMKVDTLFEQLCNALKEAGIYDDCAIFFLSDHGDFAGDYGVTEKAQSTFEDCLVRVPLLVKPPVWEHTDAGVTDSMAELVDFYATVMDYAGVDPKRTQFGRSLRPVLTDRKKENREFVCCEGGRLPEESHCDEFHASGPKGPAPSFVYWPKMKAQTDDAAHAKATMIRDSRYKYVSRITGEDEFYDLKMDPKELDNKINNHAYVTEILKKERQMLKWLQRTTDVVPFELDARF